MRAAIYARKSTEQNVLEDAKSVTRQIETAREFATKKGWTVLDEYIFVDDAVSGADFVNRDLMKLVLAAKSTTSTPRPFDVVVTMDQDRIGRDQVRTLTVLNDFVEAGVKVFFYATGQELQFDSPTDQLMVSIRNFGNQWYRHQVRERTREGMRKKAKDGHVAGGKCFGYTNRRTLEGYVERLVNEEQAKIVRRIFEMAAEGKGLVRTAKTLNEAGVPSPGGHKKGPAKTLNEAGVPSEWAPSAIRAMLYRDLYRGVIVYGKTQNVDRNGSTGKKIRRPEAEWVTVPKPELRIIPDDLWQAAHERMGKTRAAYLRRTDGRVWGRPETESRYLLTGQSACGVCGGSLFVRKRPDGRNPHRVPYAYYACTYHHLRGDRVCSNRLQMAMATADAAVLEVLRDDILNPTALALAIETAIEQYAARSGDIKEQRASLEADLRRVETEIARLVEALASGELLASVQEAIRTRERRCADIRAKLEHIDGLARIPRLDKASLTAELGHRLMDWQGLLRAEVVKARQIMRKLLAGRLTFRPDPARRLYTFEGQASYGRLLAGSVLQNAWCPRGDSNTRHAV